MITNRRRRIAVRSNHPRNGDAGASERRTRTAAVRGATAKYHSSIARPFV